MSAGQEVGNDTRTVEELLADLADVVKRIKAFLADTREVDKG
jgi:hypothetical protein